MPPPINLLVGIWACIWLTFQFLIELLSCGKTSISTTALLPVKYNLYGDLQDKKSNDKFSEYRRPTSVVNNGYVNINSKLQLQQSFGTTAFSDNTSDIHTLYRVELSKRCCFCFERRVKRQFCGTSCGDTVGRRYCRYCRNDMGRFQSETGNISDYFDLFSYYNTLDETDKNLMRELTKDAHLCPFCYRYIHI